MNFPQNLDISPLTSVYGHKLHDVFEHISQREAIKKYGIAGRIWEAAYALSLYIHPPPNMQFEPPFTTKIHAETARNPLAILELGSGTGMTSAEISQIIRVDRHDILIATDLPEVCPLLKSNLKAYTSAASLQGLLETLIYARPLSWGNEVHAAAIASEFLTESSRTLTHVICSDLVYFPELLAPLLRTLLMVTSPPFSGTPTSSDRGATVIISYKLRSLPKEAPFWSAFGLWFTFEPVLVSTGNGDWQRFGSNFEDKIFIFVAHRRAGSHNWRIPVSDQDLLAGKGAMGNNQAKSDETFESLLFMISEAEM